MEEIIYPLGIDIGNEELIKGFFSSFIRSFVHQIVI